MAETADEEIDDPAEQDNAFETAPGSIVEEEEPTEEPEPAQDETSAPPESVTDRKRQRSQSEIDGDTRTCWFRIPPRHSPF